MNSGFGVNSCKQRDTDLIERIELTVLLYVGYLECIFHENVDICALCTLYIKYEIYFLSGERFLGVRGGTSIRYVFRFKTSSMQKLIFFQ